MGSEIVIRLADDETRARYGLPQIEWLSKSARRPMPSQRVRIRKDRIVLPREVWEQMGSPSAVTLGFDPASRNLLLRETQHGWHVIRKSTSSATLEVKSTQFQSHLSRWGIPFGDYEVRYEHDNKWLVILCGERG